MATVMETKIMLVASQFSFEMIIGEREWTRVVLHRGGIAEDLGAEGFTGLAERLSKFLEDPPSTLRCAFVLSEKHTTAYGCVSGDKLLLQLQDRDAKCFAELELTDAERLFWLRQLELLQGGGQEPN